MNKGETIDRILAAAAKEIEAKGIDAAKISVIAEQAGVTKQLVYHYFKTKDQLYSAILESVAQGMRLSKNLEVYEQLSPEDGIRYIIDTIFSGFANNPSYVVWALDQALHEGTHISNANDFTPAMKQFIDGTFSKLLKRGEQSGDFRVGLDPNITFWLIFNLVVSCFLNKNTMTKVTNIDFQGEEARELWRSSASEFILHAIRASVAETAVVN